MFFSLFNPKVVFGTGKKVLAIVTAVVIALVMFLGVAIPLTMKPTLANPASGRIISFERVNPVYTEWVEIGTAREDLRLPQTLRAVCGLPEDAGKFTQTAPVAGADGDYDYYWYGYVAPMDEDILRLGKKTVVYTIYYADGREAYRVHGEMENVGEGFFACDENGNISGVVYDVPVIWSGRYNADRLGEYTFRASVSGIRFNGTNPVAKITVGEPREDHDDHSDCGSDCGGHETEPEVIIECTCGEEDTGHMRDCPLWNPECICPEEGANGHTKACPYWVPLADCECGIDSTNMPWQHMADCELFEEPSLENGACSCDGKHDPENKFCLLWKAPLFVPAGLTITGPNDIAGNNFINANTPTSGNPDFTHGGETIPGAWRDYINTRFRNDYYSNFDWMPDGQTRAYNGWKWGGTTATQSTGTTQTNPLRIPAAVGNIWRVYSGEQLYFALSNATNGQEIHTESLNLNGYNHNWSCITRTVAINLFTGTPSPANDNVSTRISNLGSNNGGLFNFTVPTGQVSRVYWIDFYNAKVLSTGTHAENVAAVFSANLNTRTSHYLVVRLYDSLLFNSSMDSHARTSSAAFIGRGINHTIQHAYVQDTIILGGSHVASLASYGNGSAISQSFADNCRVYSRAFHSGGLISCTDYHAYPETTFSQCFANVDLYGSVWCGGFSGMAAGQITDCFSTGKVEGHSVLGGFSALANSGSVGSSTFVPTFTRCYSTSLVGLRSDMKEGMGGFAGYAAFGIFNDCYAAGEVGNFNINMNEVTGYGGFASGIGAYPTTINNCYYDKQTTAMREWKAGNVRDGSAADILQMPNLKGVLTTDTDKAGTGLTSSPNSNGGGKNSFTGFSNSNSGWVFQPGYYPQLAVFVNSGVSVAVKGDFQRAVSLASTATVFLETWDEGYDWNADGVRSATEQSYNRNVGSDTHKGSQLTYDTVREIVSDFRVTPGTSWTQQIPGGAPAQSSGGVHGDNIVISAPNGTIKSPGLDWYDVSATVSGQTSKRPLRLVAYMLVDAGESKAVTSGEYYDHRDDVELTMMDTITDNLVVGIDNGRIWSQAVTNPYPDSTKFYAVPTIPTSFSVSQDALVFTEIWRAKKDASGMNFVDASNQPTTDDSKLVPEYSVRVTGPGTGSNLTMDEQKWNGEWPLYSATSRQHKYIVTYYWMLNDGRYRTDYKVITIDPGQFDVALKAFNMSDNSPNNTALSLNAAADRGANTNYRFGPASDSFTLANQGYTTNVTAAWRMRNDEKVAIKKISVTMTNLSGEVMGTVTVTGDNLKGKDIVIPVRYEYITTEFDSAQGQYREVTKQEIVNITYTIAEKAPGEYYLRFNKLANPPAYEVPAALAHGTSAGVPADANAYINDIAHNILIELWVSETNTFQINKTLGSPAEEEETFVFLVEYRGAKTTPGAVTQTLYAVITLEPGQVFGTAIFADMPIGWYSVTELDSNWRFDLDGNLLEDENPKATVDKSKGTVTRWIG